MNGLEKLTGRILEEAQAEVNGIVDAANSKADKILTEKKSEAETIYQDKIKKGQMLADQRVDRITSVAKLEAKKLILGTKQEMIAQAFEVAIDKLTKLPEADYAKFLANLAAEASNTGTEEIIFSDTDKVKYGVAVVEMANEILENSGKKASLTCSDKTADIKGGVIAKEGNIEVNCSFETIIRLKASELAPEVNGVLFK